MTQKPLPIVPWMGGKRRLAKHLLPMFPEHTCYVELLAKMMRECKGKVMLSINDHPDIRELFKGFRITELNLAYSISREKTQKTSGELVICNW